jgi:hypothetical protein
MTSSQASPFPQPRLSSFQFEAYSREILKQAQANVQNLFEKLWDLGKAITSHALDANMTWPNCTVPPFENRAHDMKRSSGTLEFVGFAPFVTPDNRDGWEQYSVENQDRIEQDYDYRNWTCTEYITPPAPIPSTIHQYNGSGLTAANYTFEDPIFHYEILLWQVAPAPMITPLSTWIWRQFPFWEIKGKK